MIRLSRAEQQRQTRERLLAAGAAVFARRGFLAATVEEVVAEAGYTRGALYKHFGGKEGLWQAISDAQVEHHLRHLADRLDQVEDRAGLIAALVPVGPAFGADEPRWGVAAHEFATWVAGHPELSVTVLSAQRERERRIEAAVARACARLGVRAAMPLAQVVVVIGALGGSLALRRAVDPGTDVHAIAAGTVAALFPEPKGAA
ncbi:TetR/AcrR family transcriptional regulator [Actinokineospora bangkokensis]|uniref:TetR family transcriptional regulator n=1 Tax=Actinokineospora bangkokensis TaxID=1193682 RepID=A0A1Q9LQQ4_9PSEU|nr:TetR/AcrR family transcriptional regulator [Actinokineospora bangkokensis]OLR94376.1 TetR family transcriptional regulator [Actinokineospora bangkokensis]